MKEKEFEEKYKQFSAEFAQQDEIQDIFKKIQAPMSQNATNEDILKEGFDSIITLVKIQDEKTKYLLKKFLVD